MSQSDITTVSLTGKFWESEKLTFIYDHRLEQSISQCERPFINEDHVDEWKSMKYRDNLNVTFATPISKKAKRTMEKANLSRKSSFRKLLLRMTMKKVSEKIDKFDYYNDKISEEIDKSSDLRGEKIYFNPEKRMKFSPKQNQMLKNKEKSFFNIQSATKILRKTSKLNQRRSLPFIRSRKQFDESLFDKSCIEEASDKIEYDTISVNNKSTSSFREILPHATLAHQFSESEYYGSIMSNDSYVMSGIADSPSWTFPSSEIIYDVPKNSSFRFSTSNIPKINVPIDVAVRPKSSNFDETLSLRRRAADIPPPLPPRLKCPSTPRDTIYATIKPRNYRTYQTQEVAQSMNGILETSYSSSVHCDLVPDTISQL